MLLTAGFPSMRNSVHKRPSGLLFFLFAFVAALIERGTHGLHLVVDLCGKGFFLVFVGVLCFDVVHGLGRPFEKMDLAVGIIVCAYAILLIVLGLMNRDGASSTKPVEPKTVAPAKI